MCREGRVSMQILYINYIIYIRTWQGNEVARCTYILSLRDGLLTQLAESIHNSMELHDVRILGTGQAV